MKTHPNVHVQNMLNEMHIQRLKRRNELCGKFLAAVLLIGSAVLFVLVMADYLN